MKIWIPNFIKQDFLRKAVSVIFAVVVWVSVSNKLGKEGKISGVKVCFSLPDNMILLDTEEHYVTLTIRTSERRMSLLLPSDFKINYSIYESRYEPGKLYKVFLTVDDIQAPFGVKILSVSPNVFYINIDKNATKKVLIRHRFAGKLAEGYKVKNIIIRPEKVKIIGPESVIGGIKVLRTMPIILDQYTIASFECPIGIDIRNYKGIKLIPSTVNARVEIVKDIVTRLFTNVPIRILQPLKEKILFFKPLSTPHVDIELSGYRKDMETITKDHIKPFIDLTPFNTPGTYNINVKCWSPVPGITVKKIVPQIVEVNIIKQTPTSIFKEKR